MANTWHLQQEFLRTFDSVIATIRAIARALAADHALALRAATKAASPRKCQAEVRAMYLPPLDPFQEGAGRPARGCDGEFHTSFASNIWSTRPACERTVIRTRRGGVQS